MKVPTKYVKEIKEEEKKKLEEIMKYGKISRERIRAHYIILSSRKYSIDEIAAIYEIDRDTVSGTIRNWEEKGYEGLKDEEKSGRPKRLEEKEIGEVKKKWKRTRGR